MNDRFRFRAWDKINKEMKDIEGFCDTTIIFNSHENYVDCWDIDAPIEDWIIMQCTGLKDKNGQLIYEGDIVDYLSDDNEKISKAGVVSYCNGAWCFGEDYAHFIVEDGFIKDTKVISNIYEGKLDHSTP